MSQTRLSEFGCENQNTNTFLMCLNDHERKKIKNKDERDIPTFIGFD